MHLRKALFQAGDEIQEILEWQIRVKAADDMKFGHGFAIAGSSRLKRLFERHGVSAGGVLFSTESAQAARRNAHIRGIDVAIDVEIRLVAMHSLADTICEPAYGQNVARAVESQRVFGVESLTRDHLLVNAVEAAVLSLK